jgi:aryl carrier-like protein
MPVGGVGELILECPSTPCPDPIESPAWWLEGREEIAARHSLYRTGCLAKYRSDGSLIFVGRKDERIDQSRPMESESPPTSSTTETEPYVTASTKENSLRELWSRVLGIEQTEIRSTDSFFDLGGDSIGAMKLVSEARLEGMTLTVAKIFRHRRLAEMSEAAEMAAEKEPSPTAEYAPFTALDVKDKAALVSALRPTLSNPSWKITDVYPARPLQEIAVNGTVRLPRYSARYELCYIDGSVDHRRLLERCQDLVARNEILRTVFVESAGDYFGVVLANLAAPVTQYEIEGDLEGFSHRLCEVDVQERMPLGSSFVKFILVQCQDGRNCLIIRISHAQYDEICLPVLLRQLSALYEGTAVPETLPFSSYVGHLVRENIPQSTEYWQKLLRGSSMSVIRPAVPIISKKPASVYRNIDISGRSKEITVATLPTAAWALCLARHLSTRDVTFGEVVSGPCWQYVPVRVNFKDGWSGLDLLNYVQDQHISSGRFEGIGLKEIVKHCTDWPETVDWFDSVVHQDVAHVESLPFLSTQSRMETVYPHLEPLREWKVQAFLKGDNLCIEIVTFESWIGQATRLLDDLEAIMEQLVNNPKSSISLEGGSKSETEKATKRKQHRMCCVVS